MTEWRIWQRWVGWSVDPSVARTIRGHFAHML